MVRIIPLNDNGCKKEKPDDTILNKTHLATAPEECIGWVTWDGKFLICGMIPDDNAPCVFEISFSNAWNQIVQ